MNKAEIAAVVIGITEMIKKLGLPSKYCPAFAIIFAIVLSVGDAYHTGNETIDLYGAIMQGLLIGVSTTGSYAALDKFIEKSNIQNANTPQETH